MKSIYSNHIDFLLSFIKFELYSKDCFENRRNEIRTFLFFSTPKTCLKTKSFLMSKSLGRLLLNSDIPQQKPHEYHSYSTISASLADLLPWWFALAFSLPIQDFRLATSELFCDFSNCLPIGEHFAYVDYIQSLA